VDPQPPSRMALVLPALARIVAGIILIGCLLFLPAGTLRFWEAWLYIALLFVPLAIVVLAAFPAVLLGGLESIPGAVLGGLLIGLIQGLVALPNNDFVLGPETAQAIRSSTAIVPYFILLIVLLIRPEGIFGQKRIERI